MIFAEIFDLDNNIVVEYDGIQIKKADDFPDSLRSDDDGSLPEYFVVDNYVIISIPLFSEHTITIQTIIEAISGTTAIILYLAIAIIAIILFVGIGEFTKRYQEAKEERLVVLIAYQDRRRNLNSK